MIEGGVTVRGDHPSLPGHFPGRPIVPGAVLLDEAISEGMRAGLPAPREIVAAKFVASLDPDTPVVVRFESRSDGKVALTCRGKADGKTFLTAVLDCQGASRSDGVTVGGER